MSKPKYEKLSEYERVVRQPDVYIGGVQANPTPMWMYDGEKCFAREMELVEGLYKIIDEIITNASDHHYNNSDTCTRIKVWMDEKEITVWNNGGGIPIEVDAKTKMYIPEMIFGHLGTSSNYSVEKRKTGGKNGLGAKLTNIFSERFVVTTVSNGVCYEQVFEDQMRTTHPPIITKVKTKTEYTQIKFTPLFRYFGLESFSEDFIHLVHKRCLDISICYNNALRVYFNDELIPVFNLVQYMELCYPNAPKVVKQMSGEWTIAIATHDFAFQECAHTFVNSVNTFQGGTHLDYIFFQLSKYVTKRLEKTPIKNLSGSLRNRLVIGINCRIVNPSFNSQSKVKLTTKQSEFGSKCELSEKTCEAVFKMLKSDIDKWQRIGSMKELTKADAANKRKSAASILKYTRAEWAGTSRAKDTVLVLSEGDSANTLVKDMRGKIPLGKERIGTYPLRGKLMNVRQCSVTKVAENECMNDLSVILGFKYGDPTTKLKYGRVLILTDQDYDGSHIKGLVINYFHTFFRESLSNDFITTFRTPILKYWNETQKFYFYTMREAEKWREAQKGTWYVTYFKGLGTIDSKVDGIVIFSNFFENIVRYREDEHTDEALHLAFDESAVPQRKEWLSRYEKDNYIDETKMDIPYSEFVHRDLIHFSNYDNIRSIPNVFDGLKPCQRKILYVCLTTKSVHYPLQMKVAQLSGKVSEQTMYHHGEASLQEAIVHMAHNYVGSNNIALLYPSGQFGSRNKNGKDSAAPRYIYTYLQKITPLIYRPEDLPVLVAQHEENYPIEPLHFMPIVPMLLINGCKGIGTGYSTTVPSFNPRTVLYNLRAMIRGEPLKTMHPFILGFKGKVIQLNAKKYELEGVWYREGGDVVIQEVTPHLSLEDHKKRLLKFIEENNEPFEYCGAVVNEDGLNIRLRTDKKHAKFFDENEVELHLNSTISLNNMTAMTEDYRPVRFETPMDVMRMFYDKRLHYYTLRKAHEVKQLARQLLMLRNRARFIKEVIDDSFRIRGRPKSEVVAEFAEKKYDADDNSYDYLLKMNFMSLTAERVVAIQKEIKDKEAEKRRKEAEREEEVWLRELDELEAAYEKYETKTLKEQVIALQEATVAANKPKTKSRGRTAK